MVVSTFSCFVARGTFILLLLSDKKIEVLHKNHMLGNLDLTGLEHWTLYNELLEHTHW